MNLLQNRFPSLVSRLLLASLLALPPLSLSAADKKVRIKLGTLAPRGTSYHKSLLSMAQKWKQASGGEVEMIIYPDGQQGGEGDMVAMMRTGNLDAGLLTAGGLADIERAVTGLQNMPMMFRSLAEVDYVGEKLRPKLEPLLQEKGFVVLFWADSGWIRFFSKQPITTPADLRKMKFFVWAGSPETLEIMKEAGFNPQPLETVDIASSLQSGLINAVPMPPFFALANQLDKRAPHMLELNWAPLVGAAIITRKAWDKIPPELQEPLRKAAAEAGREIQSAGRAESDQAVEAMKKRGLIVHPVPPALDLQWRSESELFYPKIRGRIVPPEIFDQVQQFLQEYRSRATSSK